MKDYAKNLVHGFDVENYDYRVGLMRYSTDADVQFDLDKYSTREALKLAIDKTTYKPGNTDTAKAINSVRENMFIEPRGDRNFARNLIFLLTGQNKSKDTFDAWAAAQKAEAEGINLFTVGINLNDTMELDELSTHPIETYRQLINTDQPPAELNLTLSEIIGRSMYKYGRSLMPVKQKNYFLLRLNAIIFVFKRNIFRLIAIKTIAFIYKRLRFNAKKFAFKRKEDCVLTQSFAFNRKKNYSV